ncbi:MAG: orotidine-5'-phosphate decarboxylase [Pseudomonadota bacterium]
MMFIDALRAAWAQNNSLVCVGLDPAPERFPGRLRGRPDAIFEFNRAIIDATGDLVCAFKPQIAYYAAHGAEAQLAATIDYIHERFPGVPVILDAKRGDIGSTAAQYAAEAFDRFGADAVTINPYMGRDSAAPFLGRPDRGVVILCRTSNAGAADFQDLLIDGRPLFEHVAEAIARDWNDHGNCMLVLGATWPEQLGRVRSLVGDMPFLVPGVGSQGGDAQAVVTQGQTHDGTGLVVNSSRGVLYADDGPDFAEAARGVVADLRETLNRWRRSPGS